MATADRIVKQETIVVNCEDVRISTVFLGLDHGYGYGPLLVFETMVFGGRHHHERERCSTWGQAEQQHANIVKRIRKEILKIV